jgi:transcriptional activator SPT7
LDYALPPPLIPLNIATYTTELPGLLHAFFAARIEAGLGLEDDPAFDATHSIIGSLGQVSVKAPVTMSAAKKKAMNAATAASAEEKKRMLKKPM